VAAAQPEHAVDAALVKKARNDAGDGVAGEGRGA
jgi:hypothetical protein